MPTDTSWVAIMRPTDPHVHGHMGQRVDHRERSTAKSVSSVYNPGLNWHRKQSRGAPLDQKLGRIHAK